MTANVECTDNPGAKGYHGVSDWLQLTAAEVCELEGLGKYSVDRCGSALLAGYLILLDDA